MEPKFESDDYSRFAGADYQDREVKADQLIYDEVREALLNNPLLHGHEFVIEVKDGVVTLEGAAFDRTMKKEAELSLEAIVGIKDIFNLIRINEFEDKGSEGLIRNQADEH